MTEQDTVLTVQQLMSRWNVSRSTVYRMIQRGDISVLDCGRLVRILLTSVCSYENKGEEQWNIHFAGRDRETLKSSGPKKSLLRDSGKQNTRAFQQGRKMKQRLGYSMITS